MGHFFGRRKLPQPVPVPVPPPAPQPAPQPKPAPTPAPVPPPVPPPVVPPVIIVNPPGPLVPPVVASSGAGTITSIASALLSRDVASNGGGCSITMSGCTGVAGIPSVTVGGVTATVTSTTSTSVTFTVPVLTGTTGVVTIVAGGHTFTNFDNSQTFPFEVWKAYDTLLGRATFESVIAGSGGLDAIQSGDVINTSTLKTFGDGSSIGVSTDHPHSGSQCLKLVAGSNACNWIAYMGSYNQSNDTNTATGRWHRWYLYLPAATHTVLNANGQIKLFLSRNPDDHSSEFSSLLTGAEESDSPGHSLLTVREDDGGDICDLPTLLEITSDAWHEILLQEQRYPITVNSPSGTITTSTASTACVGVGTSFLSDVAVWDVIEDSSGNFLGQVSTVNSNLSITFLDNGNANYSAGAYKVSKSKGRVRCWFDGKMNGDSNFMYAPFKFMLSFLGSDLTNEMRNPRMGMVYTQNAGSYGWALYIDDVAIANGPIDPQDV